MTNKLARLVAAVLLGLMLMSGATVAVAQSTAFTYQGKLNDAGSPANGNYDFQFKLYDMLTGGALQGSPNTVTNPTVQVTNGIFTVQLDFGASALPGADRFVEIGVRHNSGESYVILGPRQQITSTPYAVKSLKAAAADGLSVACVNCVTSSQIASVNGSAVTGAIPVASVPAGSGSYIQNTTSPQATSNFNISNNGTVGATLSANTVNSTTQYNIGGTRVLSIADGNNVFAGAGAGSQNTTGQRNSFFGTYAGFDNIVGSGNSYFGAGAGDYGGAGAGRSDNAFFGRDAGSASLGNSNAFFGAAAGEASAGINNAFFGAGAGDNSAVGSNNTLIGHATNFTSGNLTNATAIGDRAQVAQSNSVVLGSINGINGATADTSVGIGVTVPSYPLTVVGTTGSGQNQGVAEFGSAAAVPDTGIRIRNNATSGRTWTVFSSGTGSGLGAGNFTIFDATGNAARLTIDSSGNILIPGASSSFFGSTTRQMLNLWGTVYGIGIQANTFYTRSDGGFAWFRRGVHSDTGNDAGAGGTVLMRLDQSGNLNITGSISKGGGSFKIDHPLDPENKYLYHSFVESPDMKNIYDGNVTTNARGLAIITLPEYFESLNRDYRYQLTVLGQFAQAVVLRKIRNNRFVIKTSKPRVEVSWQVTGIRQDAYANKYRIQVEEEKAAQERGTFLHPEAFNISSARMTDRLASSSRP